MRHYLLILSAGISLVFFIGCNRLSQPPAITGEVKDALSSFLDSAKKYGYDTEAVRLDVSLIKGDTISLRLQTLKSPLVFNFHYDAHFSFKGTGLYVNSGSQIVHRNSGVDTVDIHPLNCVYDPLVWYIDIYGNSVHIDREGYRRDAPLPLKPEVIFNPPVKHMF
jgi:hypothetical protein